jgi:hypothetical protein
MMEKLAHRNKLNSSTHVRTPLGNSGTLPGLSDTWVIYGIYIEAVVGESIEMNHQNHLSCNANLLLPK